MKFILLGLPIFGLALWWFNRPEPDGVLMDQKRAWYEREPYITPVKRGTR